MTNKILIGFLLNSVVYFALDADSIGPLAQAFSGSSKHFLETLA
jgi:hypothetical protein